MSEENLQHAAAPSRHAAVLPGPGPRVAVIGIGNTLLADDGAGVRAIECLRRDGLGAAVELVDGGTLNFTLLQYLEDAPALVVIDAGDLGGKPGTVRVFIGADMDEVVASGRRNSVHESGLADLLAMARLKDCLPAHRALITVQPARVDWGDALSPAVAAALPGICERARLFALRWAE